VPENNSLNRWWRFVPQSRRSGMFAIAAWTVVLVSSVIGIMSWAKMSGGYEFLELIIGLLAAVNLLRVSTGLAALTRR
jgi:hypothetical protein